MTPKTKLQVLQEVEQELKRFQKKLSAAISEQKRGEGLYQSQIYAASKRSALDLKVELTKLTQDCKYRWS